MNDKAKLIRDTDDAARRQARTLLRGARFAAMGVIDPETGFPSVSRVLIVTDIDGVPVILVSELSAHTQALSRDKRCSLMTGEPAKGDPLAHPRLMVQCLAEPVDHDSETHGRLRARFLARHPKTQLYIDFSDFRFVKLVPQRAALNAGFGRAFHLDADDLLIENGPYEFLGSEDGLLLELGGQFPELASQIATGIYGAAPGNWRFCTVDKAGIDISFNDLIVRHEFGQLVRTKNDMNLVLPNSVYAVP
ncbi:HugZ family protein [Peteryoungia ipomoeae]|uniref:HugZ family protein n=1 Tax=Peteryoungia ipomoeae TaxID=1210932 RepID=A0A4S8NUR8_9HYPH|nr:pyridoxamine 5'-phosphate oxidase family protein [Peteryoungia ipomoeae]THV21317.1 HugZ family protein [Peteryoungia ipomoeae]